MKPDRNWGKECRKFRMTSTELWCEVLSFYRKDIHVTKPKVVFVPDSGAGESIVPFRQPSFCPQEIAIPDEKGLLSPPLRV